MLYSEEGTTGLLQPLLGGVRSLLLSKPRGRALASVPCQQHLIFFFISLLFLFSFPAGGRPVLRAPNSWQVYCDGFLAGSSDAVHSVCLKDSLGFFLYSVASCSSCFEQGPVPLVYFFVSGIVGGRATLQDQRTLIVTSASPECVWDRTIWTNVTSVCWELWVSLLISFLFHKKKHV